MRSGAIVRATVGCLRGGTNHSRIASSMWIRQRAVGKDMCSCPGSTKTTLFATALRKPLQGCSLSQDWCASGFDTLHNPVRYDKTRRTSFFNLFPFLLKGLVGNQGDNIVVHSLAQKIMAQIFDNRSAFKSFCFFLTIGLCKSLGPYDWLPSHCCENVKHKRRPTEKFALSLNV